jgi:hypothetical protein
MMDKNIACIDADHIFYLSLTGEKLLDENGEPIKVDGKFTYRERTFEESCNIADNYITDLLNKTNSYGYIGFFGGSSTYRKRIYPEYKANRKDLAPLKNLLEMKSYLADKWNFEWLNSNVSLMHSDGNIYETDDYVASFVKQIPNSFIVSPDKDLLMLEGTHYNPKKNEWVTNTTWDECKSFWASMIIGDKADNIPGLKNKAEAFVNSVFKDTTDYPETVLSCYIGHYNSIDIAIEQFYKHYKCLKIKDDLDVIHFHAINWENTILQNEQLNIE